MKISEYEIIDEVTGEIVSVKTEVDLTLLEAYNQWVIDRKLSPPTYSPQEYAEYLEGEFAKYRVKLAIEYIERYDLDTAWPPEMYRRLLGDLKNAKE
jgi:hypothetical protein